MGNALALLTPEQLQKLKDQTNLEEKEIGLILKRYAAYDTSEKGTDGIPVRTIAMFPEFVNNPLIPRIAEVYMDPLTGRIFPENFIYFVTVLRSQTEAEVKKNLAFQCFDCHGTGELKQDEVFRMYKLLFRGALTDDQILEMVMRALRSPYLSSPGSVSEDDFFKLIPERELTSRFTADLQLGS